MALPGGGKGQMRGHGGHAARAVNLDTGHHVDSKGNTHKTHPGNPPKVGPDTLIFAAGHPTMSFLHHKRRNTAIHKRMVARGNPHPHDIMAKMIPALLPGGGMPPPQPGMGAPMMGQPPMGGAPMMPGGAPPMGMVG